MLKALLRLKRLFSSPSEATEVLTHLFVGSAWAFAFLNPEMIAAKGTGTYHMAGVFGRELCAASWSLITVLPTVSIAANFSVNFRLSAIFLCSIPWGAMLVVSWSQGTIYSPSISTAYLCLIALSWSAWRLIGKLIYERIMGDNS